MESRFKEPTIPRRRPSKQKSVSSVDASSPLSNLAPVRATRMAICPFARSAGPFKAANTMRRIARRFWRSNANIAA